MPAPAFENDAARLRREAQDWLIRFASGEATGEDARRFHSWRRTSPAHEAAWDKVRGLWHSSAAVLTREGLGTQPLPAESTAPVPETTTNAARLPVRPSLMPRLSLVGACLATLAIILLAYPPERWFADYSTGVGEQRLVELPDGSSAQLNTQTALALHYTPQERSVTLLTGEAVFQVSKDPRPFVVESGTSQARAVGTEFTVSKGEEGTTIAVIEGIVDVRLSTRNEVLRLDAGRIVSVDPTRGIEKVDGARMQALTAWRDGYLVFDDTPLQEVVAQINRYRRGHVVLLNATLRQRKVNGIFRIDAIDKVLPAIEAMTQATSFSITPYLVVLR